VPQKNLKFPSELAEGRKQLSVSSVCRAGLVSQYTRFRLLSKILRFYDLISLVQKEIGPGGFVFLAGCFPQSAVHSPARRMRYLQNLSQMLR
jgi:hypothetical protein